MQIRGGHEQSCWQHYAREPGQHTGYEVQFIYQAKYPGVWGAGEFNLLEPHSGQVGGMVRHETVVWIKVVGTEKFMFLYTRTVHLSGQATTVQWLWTETQYLLIIFQNIFRQRERQKHAGGEGDYWGE